MKTEEEIKNIVAAMAPQGVAVAAVIGVIGLIVLTSRYLYIKMTGIPEYDRQELISYGKLVNLYRKHMHVAEIPLEWELDHGKPTHDYDLGNSADTLFSGLADIKISHPSIQFAAQGMLSTIIKLLNSVSKRTFGKIRQGSVEGMFFVELAHWIVQELPLIDYQSENGLEQLREMKLYCESVLTEVLTPESDAYRNHPIGALGTIIEDLTGILTSTENLIKSVTFHDHIVRLDNAILGMAAQSFHVIKLMINGDHEYQPDLSVALLIDKEQIHRSDIIKFKEQRFASWLEKTIRKADIRCNDFNHHNNSLTCQEIDMP